MPTALENAVDALSDQGVPLPDALRRLLVVARRIRADSLAGWIGNELSGYGLRDSLPAYRSAAGMPVALRFVGPMQRSVTHNFSVNELPSDLRAAVEAVAIREPLASCVALAGADSDPELSLPHFWVTRYRELAEQRKAARIDMMVLDAAAVQFPRTHLLGVLDRIRTTALELALAVEDTSPSAGSPGGPTVANDVDLARAVSIGVVNVFGAAAIGEGAQAFQIARGDIAALLTAAGHYLGQPGVQELEDAIEADGKVAGSATKEVLERVKRGSLAVAAGMTVNGAYDGLLQLLQMAFPDFGG